MRHGTDEAAHRERKELHKELLLIRRLSNKCTDAAKLTELKAAIAALRDEFKNSLQEESPSVSAGVRPPKRRKQDGGPPGLQHPKAAQRDNRDHVY